MSGSPTPAASVPLPKTSNSVLISELGLEEGPGCLHRKDRGSVSPVGAGTGVGEGGQERQGECEHCGCGVGGAGQERQGKCEHCGCWGERRKGPGELWSPAPLHLHILALKIH